MTTPPRVRFVMAAEARPAYVNMAALCCWSIRSRGGALSNAAVSVVFNDRADDAAAKWLESRLGVDVSVHPRRSPTLHFLNKLNALDASDPAASDWTVYLDCDTAVVNPLDDLAAWMRDGTDAFGAAPVNAKAAWKYDRIILRHTDLTPDQLEAHAHPWFNTRYPYFNGGVFCIRSAHLPEFRLRYEKLTRKLFEEMKSGWNPVRWATIKWNRRVCKSRHADALVIGPFFTRYYAEQVALAVTVLGMRLPYRVLPGAYNWKLPDTGHGEETPIRILHYLQSRHPIDRARLFTGGWVDDYADDPWEGRRELARIVRGFVAANGAAPFG